MRVILFAESFLPHMNGVTHSLLQVLRHLERRGDEALVVAPRSGPIDQELHGARTALLRSIPLPQYPEVRLTFARSAKLAGIIDEFRPHVAHLASPFVLGWQAVQATAARGIPSVAVYQTDIAGYAERYGMPAAAPTLARHITRLHSKATLTLAPSSSSIRQLDDFGVDRVRLWGRGVDTERFQPSRRSAQWRRRIAPGGEVLVGYVGRLAAEKQVEDLAALAGLPGVRLVIIGDGPLRPSLERLLPDAAFTGFLGGTELAEALASLDVFVHPGESETFCQTVQEALASGVPVVATGSGGPVDLVTSSVTGWLYQPGDLAELRARVGDLTGDPAKRAAFAIAARESVLGRSWASLGDQLMGHYEDAIAATDLARTSQRSARSASATAPERTVQQAQPAPAAQPARGAEPLQPVQPRWRSYVALGDSLTEGLCDTSRMAAGEYRGWADRLATLLAQANPAAEPFGYANLALRSRRTADVVNEQIPRAIELGADLVSVLIGANDLVRTSCNPRHLAEELAGGIRALRSSGAEVLLMTVFSPYRPYLRGLEARFESFNARLMELCDIAGVRIVDAGAMRGLAQPAMWAADRVHLNSRGHRALAYAAAGVLEVPDALALGSLEEAVHDEDIDVRQEAFMPTSRWLVRHVAPWLYRRMRGRTAGDGRSPKHDALVPLPGGGTSLVRWTGSK